MSAEVARITRWREKLRSGLKLFGWDGLLAISTLALFVGGLFAYLTTIRQVRNETTDFYLKEWNSKYMLEQRRILATWLLLNYHESDLAPPKEPPTKRTCENEEKKGRLTASYLSQLYGGPDPFRGTPVPTDYASPEFSAFESVRTFFEEIGAAFAKGDLTEHEAFQTFSLPAETYWRTAVSGWLAKQPSGDQSVGTEFAYFECRTERDEKEHQVWPIRADELRLVLEQDANLPDPSTQIAALHPAKSVVFGSRIPIEYFVTKGVGESNEGIPPDPYETFSYDLALNQASIEDFNVVPYTSVLAPEAQEVPLDEVKPTFHHGAVLEVIMAKQGGVRNQTVCAGVGRVWARDAAGKDVGGYAAEYEFAYDKQVSVAAGEDDATKQLTRSLNHELAIRGFKQTRQMKFTVACLPIHKKYGMAIAALGFVKFIFPKVEIDRSHGAER